MWIRSGDMPQLAHCCSEAVVCLSVSVWSCVVVCVNWWCCYHADWAIDLDTRLAAQTGQSSCRLNLPIGFLIDWKVLQQLWGRDCMFFLLWLWKCFTIHQSVSFRWFHLFVSQEQCQHTVYRALECTTILAEDCEFVICSYYCMKQMTMRNVFHQIKSTVTAW